MHTDYCQIDFSAVEFAAMHGYLERMRRHGWQLCAGEGAAGTPGRLLLSFVRQGQDRLPH
jgi:hypothetical protein